MERMAENTSEANSVEALRRMKFNLRESQRRELSEEEEAANEVRTHRLQRTVDEMGPHRLRGAVDEVDIFRQQESADLNENRSLPSHVVTQQTTSPEQILIRTIRNLLPTPQKVQGATAKSSVRESFSQEGDKGLI